MRDLAFSYADEAYSFIERLDEIDGSDRVFDHRPAEPEGAPHRARRLHSARALQQLCLEQGRRIAPVVDRVSYARAS
jgi:hypothetical protein